MANPGSIKPLIGVRDGLWPDGVVFHLVPPRENSSVLPGRIMIYEVRAGWLGHVVRHSTDTGGGARNTVAFSVLSAAFWVHHGIANVMTAMPQAFIARAGPGELGTSCCTAGLSLNV